MALPAALMGNSYAGAGRLHVCKGPSLWLQPLFYIMVAVYFCHQAPQPQTSCCFSAVLQGHVICCVPPLDGQQLQQTLWQGSLVLHLVARIAVYAV